MKQDRALEIMLGGSNCLISGPAGAGKSYLLGEFILTVKKSKKKVVITATTGLAAAHLGGQTLHSWSGIGLGTKLHEDYIYQMSEVRKKSIRKTDILVIDEVSMMHDYNLDMVDEAMRLIRESDQPFGGMQVILCGDFFQLPPVSKSNNGRFITRSKVWPQMDLKVCYLEEQFRAEDLRLQGILNALRAGTLTNSHLKQLKERMNYRPTGDVPRLYTLNKDVDRINAEELAKVPGDSHYFMRTSRGYYDAIKRLQESVLAPEVLELKLSATVMAVKNSPEGLYANGSMGHVVAFTSDGLPVVQFNNRHVVVYPDEWEAKSGDKTSAAITQIPLRLGYAITVHKSQGMTLEAAEMNLKGAFVEGQGYVALSRVKSLDKLYLLGLNQRALMVSEEAQIIDKMLKVKSRSLVK